MSAKKGRKQNPAVREIIITVACMAAAFVLALAAKAVADLTVFPFAVSLVLFLILGACIALLILNAKRRRLGDDAGEDMGVEYNNI